MTPEDWNDAYDARPHWDLGRPQPALRALADAGVIRGRVLDVGCGTGEHVLMSAALGLDATGVDIAPAPLRLAERKARERGLPARFVLGDAYRLTDLGQSYDTVLDCGLFHILDDRSAYVESLFRVLNAEGRFVMLGFSDREPGDEGPRRLTRDELVAAFAGGWRIDALERTTLDSPTRPDAINAWRLVATRMPRSEARVPTRRAERYLAQLCRHAEAMGEHGSGARLRLQGVERSGDGAVLRFDRGRCVVRAEPDALVLSVEAGDAESRRQVETLIAADIERFGHRDELTVTWHTEG